MTLGEIINVKRRYKGISRKDLGLMCGYKNANTAMGLVCDWENDVRPVPLDKIRIVSEVLEIPLDRFIPEIKK